MKTIKTFDKRKYTLITKRVFCFNYQKKDKEKYRVEIKKDSDLILTLTEAEFTEKKRIVAEMYGYPYDGIDVGFCTNVEGFIKLNNK